MRTSSGSASAGRVTKQQGINFGYPVIDAAGAIITIAFVAVDLASLNRMAVATHLPDQTIVTVIDRDGVVLARHPEITECLLVTGNLDYMLRIWVRDIEALGIFIRDVLQSIPAVAETTTMVILKQDGAPG